jgi:hypothetical protein
MGIEVVTRWSSAEVDYPGSASIAQPWLGGPVSVAPPNDYFSPDVKPPAQNFNWLFAKEDAQAQYAYNLAITAAIENFGPGITVNTIAGFSSDAGFVGALYDPAYGYWAILTGSGTPEFKISITQDGGRTWTVDYTNTTITGAMYGFALGATGLELFTSLEINSGAFTKYHSIVGSSDVSAALAYKATDATIFSCNGFFLAFMIVQVSGVFTAALQIAPNNAHTPTYVDKSSYLPSAWQTTGITDHAGSLLFAINQTGNTALVACCGATLGTDTANLLEIVVGPVNPTCTDVTANATFLSVGALAPLQIVGVAYSANDGLWGIAANSNADVGVIYTSPDLVNWTLVYESPAGDFISGLSVVGSVWVTSLNGQILASGNVALLQGNSTWGFAPANIALLADGVHKIHSNGNQLLALGLPGGSGAEFTAADLAYFSGSVGFTTDTPGAPFAEPIGNQGVGQRAVVNFNNVAGSVTNTQSDVAVGFYGLTANQTCLLPANPGVGQEVVITDLDGSLATYSYTIEGNGNNINGASTYVLSSAQGAKASITLIFYGTAAQIGSAAGGWHLV